MTPGDQARRDRFHVSLDARNLPCEQNIRMRAQLQRGLKQRGRIDVGIPMDLPVAQELRLLQARNHAQNPLLLAEFQVVLKAHQIPAIRAQVLLAQLHHRLRPSPGARIGQTHRLHRTEPQRIRPAPRDLLDGQACLEIRYVVGDMRGDRLCFLKRIEKALVLLLIERAIQIIVGAIERLAVTRGAKRDRSYRTCRLPQSG